MNEEAKNPLLIYREKLANGEVEPTPRRSLKERFEESPTRKNAINLFCQGCMGGVGNPSWRNDVKNCTSPKCPLYQYRI